MAAIAVRASHLSYGEGHGYHSEPKLISQSVGPHELPVKVVRITKTVAIKVPVPYPVKVGRPTFDQKFHYLPLNSTEIKYTVNFFAFSNQ